MNTKIVIIFSAVMISSAIHAMDFVQRSQLLAKYSDEMYRDERRAFFDKASGEQFALYMNEKEKDRGLSVENRALTDRVHRDEQTETDAMLMVRRDENALKQKIKRERNAFFFGVVVGGVVTLGLVALVRKSAPAAVAVPNVCP